jgi:esterase FrsA
MALERDPAGPRPFEEVRQMMLERARMLRNPFEFTNYDEVAFVLSRLDSVDRNRWAQAFSSLAEPYEQRAVQAEARDDARGAMHNYLVAHNYCRVARYPAPNSPAKLLAYRRGQDNYLKAARYFDPPLERVEMPFQARQGEGSVSVGYLRKPNGLEPPPVVVLWGGIDSFKEERRGVEYLAAGLATLSIDMPGVGDAPLAGSEDAERLWDAIFDWIDTRPDLDRERTCLVGGSTGAYWSTKVAHTHRERIRAAVDHGGPTHLAFTPEWITQAQFGEYPFELAETLAYAFGRSTYEDWLEYSPRLSLLRQGILDRPCAPLLLVNGLSDSVFPIADMYLLLEYGDPKSARFFPGGHMGNTPQTIPTIIRWLHRHLGDGERTMGASQRKT